MNSYRKNFLMWEGLAAIIISVATAAVSEFVIGREHLSDLLMDKRTVLYTTLASIGGSLVGFIITALSIIVGLVQGPLFTALRKDPSYSMLFHIFLQTITALAITTGVSLLGIIIDRGQPLSAWIPYVLWWALLLSILRLIRTVWVLRKIIEIQYLGRR